MKDSEWAGVVAVLTANWPHQLPPEMALAKWRADLDDLPMRDALAAVEAIYRDGERFPPNGAQIRQKAIELSQETQPDWSRGYRLATQLPGRTSDDRSLTWLYRPTETMAWLEGEDEIAAETVRRLGVQGWAERLTADEGMWRANFRWIYEEVASARERKQRYAGLSGTDRGRVGGQEPKHIGGVVKELAAGLGGGGDE